MGSGNGAEGRHGGDIPELRGIRILIVEDDPEARATITFLLEMHGAEVRAAESVQAALDAFDEYAPDIILSDLNLPDASGYDLICELRGRGESAPAVAVSGELGNEADVLAHGFQACLSKPVSSVDLADTVSHLTAHRDD